MGCAMGMSIDVERRSVSLDPRDPAFFNDPYPAYHAIRATTPVFFWEQYGFWCFARHAQVSALLRDRRFGRQILHLTSRQKLGWSEPPAHLRSFLDVERHSLLELEPPEHTRLRNLINRAFVSRQVERLAPRIESLANELIDRFEARGAVDLLEHFATPIPVIVIAELLGVPGEMWARLLDWSHRMVAMYQFGVTRAVEDSAVAATQEFVAFLRDYVEARRGARTDDLISQLISAESEAGRLSEEELIATCILVLNAGHEATVHGVGNGVKALLEAHIDPSRAFATPAASAAMVEELLRFDAPLHLFTRYALEDIDLDGVALRQGDRIGLLLGAANRDPERFSNPDLIDVSRSPNPHVAFGGGIHFCIGAPLARLEMEIALPILFRRLPGLRLAEPPRYRDSYHFHGLAALPVAW
ncbi:cytochrome P450 [Methylocapsa sp. S129]|uniref:cytochrome P450 n=1 Tax=Methylocapsa sp. S129 TaxID=1641869 RepID=UPI0015774D05|nr:cytochrome P450 [Methylocapsa sp. S129]